MSSAVAARVLSSSKPHGATITASGSACAIASHSSVCEFAFGAWEGLTWAEILAERPHLSEANWHHAQLYAPEGGENFDAVCARVRSFCDDLAAQEVRSAVAVTHAGTLHALLSVLALPESKQAVPVNFFPASITRVVNAAGGWRLIDGPTVPP